MVGITSKWIKHHAQTRLQDETQARRHRRVQTPPRRDLAELAQALRAAGISDYSIFLDEESLTLFAVQKLSEANTAAWLPQTEVMQKWWAYMAPLMEVNPDNSPVCTELPEIFHLA